ncbi:class I SAM-dependent RNA methyltransferase [Aliihoeflea sp. PC F10.4]
MSAVLTIDHLGAQGDGVAATPSGQVFVPFTLPGERVTVSVGKGRGDLLAILDASPERVDPACRHFGTCGGCALQHMEMSAYLGWKRDKVIAALKGRGIDDPVAEIIACAPHSRRRVVFAVRRTERAMLLGYNQALSHQIVDIAECPISVPAIVDALPSLRELSRIVCSTGDAFRMSVTATASGLDIEFRDSGKLADTARHAASRYTLEAGFARVSVDGEIVIEPVKPMLPAGDVPVELPPGAFVQAVASAEQAMSDIVADHLRRAKNVADLFCGWGTFALRLAKRSQVHAVEADQPALDALDRAFRFGEGLKRVTTEKRDLFRRPLTFKELDAGFDGLVFDPPRAGAEDQAKQIARSKVPYVAAVSCNPVTLARDLEILIAGGYALKSVTPVDQFLWSAHVETVALLEKPKKRR